MNRESFIDYIYIGCQAGLPYKRIGKTEICKKGFVKMKKKLKTIGKMIGAVMALLSIGGVAVGYIDKKQNKRQDKDAENGNGEFQSRRPYGIYEAYFKRSFDFICGMLALIVFWPLYLVIAALVKVKLGSPVLFIQERPGLNEKIFKLYKFRTMTDERGENGELLPDEVRLTKFGKWLRSTSLDELPEVFNIVNGTMSVVGPRPQLVRDMVFMTDEQRMRHMVKPGLSGLAQINGRNGISWEEKLAWDLKYIDKITVFGDVKIIIDTVKKAFIKKEGISQDDMATAEDYGDYLLRIGKVEQEEYESNQKEARELLNRHMNINIGDEDIERGLCSIIMPSYNTALYIQEAVQSVLDQTYTNWELLIVDDCSSDNTDEILKKFTDKRIRIFKNDKNSGAAVSRNRALRKAKGKWIAFLDSDDLWMPEKLEHQIHFMEKNNYSFSYTNYKEIDCNGNQTGVKVTGPEKITKHGMYRYCWPGCLTVVYNAEKIGLVQIEDIKKNNDYAIWLRVCQKSDCFLLNEDLALYRRGRRGSISTHSYTDLIRWHYRLFRKAEKEGVILSLVNTGSNLLFGLYKKMRYVKVE